MKYKLLIKHKLKFATLFHQKRFETFWKYIYIYIRLNFNLLLLKTRVHLIIILGNVWGQK